MKSATFLIGILSATACFADIYDSANVNDRLAALEAKIFCEPIQNEEYGFNTWGEFLFWRTNFSLPYAYTHETILPDSLNLDTNIVIHNVRPGYDPGFRVGIGYETPYDQWDLALTWTYFDQEESQSVEKTAEIDVHSIWQAAATQSIFTANSADATFHEFFETLDFLLGKSFSWSSAFRFRYFMGMKGARIEEKENIFYDGVNTGTDPVSSESEKVTLINNFFGGGFTNGLDTFWNLKGGFSLYGRGELGVLWGRIKLKQNDFFESSNPTELFTPYRLFSNNTLYDLKMNLSLALGINWGIDLCKKKAHLSLGAGYEFNYWPNQILISSYLETSQDTNGGLAVIIPQLSDVGFQGYDFRVRLDF